MTAAQLVALLSFIDSQIDFKLAKLRGTDCGAPAVERAFAFRALRESLGISIRDYQDAMAVAHEQQKVTK